MKIHDLVTIKSPESMRTMLTDGMRLRTSGRNEQLVEDNDGDHQGKSRRQAGRMRYFFLIFVALTVILTAAPSAMPSLRGGSRMTPGSGSSFFTRLSGSPRKRLHEGNDNSRQGEEVGEGERIHVESPSSDSLDCSPSFLEKEEPRSKYDCGQMKVDVNNGSRTMLSPSMLSTCHTLWYCRQTTGSSFRLYTSCIIRGKHSCI